MISLPKYNSLFIALSKVGSSSIRGTCRKLGIFRREDEYVPDYISHKHLQHLNAEEYQRVLGEEDFEKRFKFAIVKNPWALLVSNYLAACRQPGLLRQIRGAYKPELFHEWVVGGNKSTLRPFDKDYFDNLLCPRHDNPKSRLYKGYEGNQVDGALCKHHRYTYDSQLSWLLDKDGKQAVDFIGRFENIDADFRTILTKINDIHPLPEGSWDLLKTNSASRGHDYKWYYNDETIEIVREHYRTDIEEFGYEY